MTGTAAGPVNLEALKSALEGAASTHQDMCARLLELQAKLENGEWDEACGADMVLIGIVTTGMGALLLAAYPGMEDRPAALDTAAAVQSRAGARRMLEAAAEVLIEFNHRALKADDGEDDG